MTEQELELMTHRNSKVFVKNCSIINSGYDYFATKEEYLDWAVGNDDPLKVIVVDELPDMRGLDIIVEEGFMRIKTLVGGTVSIPYTHVFIDANKTTISKIFTKYWYRRND